MGAQKDGIKLTTCKTIVFGSLKQINQSSGYLEWSKSRSFELNMAQDLVSNLQALSVYA